MQKMRNPYFYTVTKYITFSSLLFLVYSCKSKVIESKPVASDSEYFYSSDDVEDCFSPRKTVDVLTDEYGDIMYIADMYIIKTTDPERRFQPCEMPEAFRKEGLKVIFSGDRLESFPHERRVASPFRLTYMKARSE